MRIVSIAKNELNVFRVSVFIFCLSFIYSSKLLSQPEIKAVFTEKAPAIDGFVDDEVWAGAAVVKELYQKEPRNGDPVTEKTEFLFLFDHNNIYVGIRCFDDPKGIIAKELARDVSLGEDDRIQIIFDTYLDGRSGYWFQLGPRGSIGDALINENGKYFNKAWDGIWDGKAKITETGWEGELIIPFKTMGFNKASETWGLKCIRYVKRKSETATWPATSLNSDKFQVSDEGRLTGLKGMTQGIGLDLIPYATGGLSKKENSDPELVIDIGMDAFYQITPSLKIALTANTDFAQTEVDEKQINLTRFSLYFPEK
ncbi:MAG: carbohydrate binding family 9 domain-containing protein [Bacteroidia bacterium]|nr:carbohydrate binding family 9 domain-containing protein [Bacteroidia bacterium]